jgi:hypothetical protein
VKFIPTDDEDGNLTSLTFDPEGDTSLMPVDPECAIAFDARYEYGTPGTHIEPIWVSTQTGFDLQEAGVIELTGVPKDGVPQPVDVDGSRVFVYYLCAA